MRLGFNLPQIGPAGGPEAIVTVATAAENMGFATLWVADRLLSGALPEVFHNVIDPVGTLTFVAARTICPTLALRRSECRGLLPEGLPHPPVQDRGPDGTAGSDIRGTTALLGAGPVVEVLVVIPLAGRL